MAGILQRAIQVLDRLYNFPGGTRGLSEFDLAGAIQPVHDLSREAEFGSRGAQDSGYLYIGQTLDNDSSGAETTRVSTDPYVAFTSIGEFSNFRTADHRLWLMGVFGSVDTLGAANWTNMQPALQFANDRVLILANYDADVTAPIASGSRPLVQNEASLPQPFQMPIFLPVGTLLVTASASTDDVISRLHAIFWGGPIGVTPPGMR